MKTANDFPGVTDSDRLEAAIAARESGIVVIPRRVSDIEPERDWWLIDRAILLTSDTTVILQSCKIKLSDKCRDNFFRSANCGIGIEDVPRLSNIHIKGEGLCILEGADHPRAVGDSSKTLHNPCPKEREDFVRLADWVPEERRRGGDIGFWDIHNHSYGTDAGKEGEVQHGDWRGIGILLACVDNFSISGLRMVDTHGWAISCEDCANGRLEKLDFDMDMSKVIDGMRHNMENQDGIDIRNGCHDIIISDVTGGTGDDLIALTAIARRDVPVRPSGTCESTHILHNDWSRRDTDIHDIIIRNVVGYSKGGICYIIRLLPALANIYNVVIDGIIDSSPADVNGDGVLLLGDFGGYGENLKDSMKNITISNVICSSNHAIYAQGYLSDSVITNVVNRSPSCPVITCGHPDSLVNVVTSNLCSASGRIIE